MIALYTILAAAYLALNAYGLMRFRRWVQNRERVQLAQHLGWVAKHKRESLNYEAAIALEDAVKWAFDRTDISVLEALYDASARQTRRMIAAYLDECAASHGEPKSQQLLTEAAQAITTGNFEQHPT